MTSIWPDYDKYQASTDREIIAAHALYWYSLAAAFAALWYVVYVTK